MHSKRVYMGVHGVYRLSMHTTATTHAPKKNRSRWSTMMIGSASTTMPLLFILARL